MYHTGHSTEQNRYCKIMVLQLTFLGNTALSNVRFSPWLYVTFNFPAGLSEEKGGQVTGPKVHGHSKAQPAPRACFIHYAVQSLYAAQLPTGPR